MPHSFNLFSLQSINNILWTAQIWTSSLCNFHHPPRISSYILFSIPSSNTTYTHNFLRTKRPSFTSTQNRR
jgi:hypothetical protein